MTLGTAASLMVSIRAPKDALDLTASDTAMYAALGRFTAQCAGLEHLLERFIFTYGKSDTPLVRKTIVFPVSMQEKINFIISAYIENMHLRECGDAEDRLELNSIGYLLEEIWSARIHLIHGDLYFSKHNGDDFSFKSKRYSRTVRNKYEELTYEISRGAILRLLENITYLKSLLRVGLEILDGGSPKIEFDQIQRNRASFRERRQTLLNEGQEIDPHGFVRFFAGEAG